MAARKTEDADSILHRSKLLRIEMPDSEGDNIVDNIRSKTGGDNLDKDDNDDEEDDDEEMPPPPRKTNGLLLPRVIILLSSALIHIQRCHPRQLVQSHRCE